MTSRAFHRHRDAIELPIFLERRDGDALFRNTESTHEQLLNIRDTQLVGLNDRF